MPLFAAGDRGGCYDLFFEAWGASTGSVRERLFYAFERRGGDHAAHVA